MVLDVSSRYMILDPAAELMMMMMMMMMMAMMVMMVMMCSTTGLKVAIGMHARFFFALQLCESISFSQGNPADLYVKQNEICRSFRRVNTLTHMALDKKKVVYALAETHLMKFKTSKNIWTSQMLSRLYTSIR